MLYRVEYSPDAEDHLRALTARQQATVLDAVDAKLTRRPAVETRNRKPMRPNLIAVWELRVGDLRVYYCVEDGEDPVVHVRAIGIKVRDRVRIGKDTIRL
jgi:mRNA-degrading endonuclease RelE of RelBE toxin-antitoxin system